MAFFHSHLPRLVGIRCGQILGRAAGRYLRWLYNRFDLVMAPSRIMCDYLGTLGVRRVQLQPLGVDAQIFHPSRRHDRLRRELGIPARRRLLVYAGRFSGEKNIPTLLETFERLGNDYHLLMVGGGESRRAAENITFWPYRRDSAQLAAVLASADALIHAGTAETFGLVILEAMSCGRPVIGVNAGAVRELIDDEVGVTAPRADAATLARAVHDLYDRNLDALGIAARERVMTHYCWEKALRHQLGTYAAMLGVREALTAEPAPAGITS